MKKSLRNWREAFFRKEIFDPGQAEALASAPREADFILRATTLRKGQSLLDLCCGTGRHALLLARRRLRVVGVDATEEYLREARRRAKGVANLRFVRGDMRRLPFQGAFDGAINLWTSFGYFADPADDLRTLRAVAAALKPGGKFLIDVMNAAWLRRHFLAKQWERRGDGSYLLQEARLIEGKDPATVNRWTILRRGRRRAEATVFVRNYDNKRLSALLKKAGLVPVRRWGSLAGAPFRSDSKRLVVLARKKA